MKKTLYLAGPIQGCSDAEANGWRNQVIAAWGALWIRNPMSRDFRGTEIDAQSAALIVLNDLRDIDAAHVLLAYIDRISVGTSMEIFHAARTGKKVIVIYKLPMSTLSPWLIHHSDRIVVSVEMALALLKMEGDDE